MAERWIAVQWAQGLPLLALEPRDRSHACRAVHPRVGHLASTRPNAPPAPPDEKLRPAMALCLTQLTPRSSLPVVRAR